MHHSSTLWQASLRPIRILSDQDWRADSPSVVGYALDRLAALGIEHVFGVSGDYAFPLNDAVEVHPHLQWVPSSNELNAAYDADGYARLVLLVTGDGSQ